jgi:hypothetical protein
MEPWKPILSGSDRERALSFVEAISARLVSRSPSDASLQRGHASRAILHRSLAEAGLSVELNRDRCRENLLACFAAIEESPLSLGLAVGISGMAFASAYCAAFIGLDENVLTEFDDLVGACVAQRPWLGHFDLLTGILGPGIYGLQRGTAGAQIVAETLARLGELAEEQAIGCAWRTVPAHGRQEWTQQFPDGYLDLGVAHGSAGVVGFAATAAARGVCRERASRTYAQGVGWLLSQADPAREPSAFPDLAVPVRHGRLAWCYGAPGILATSTMALESLTADTHVVLKNLTEQTGRDVVRTMESQEIGICHGLSGLALIFMRLYKRLGWPECLSTASSCVQCLLARLQLIGPQGLESPALDRTFLTGMTGVVLVLLAAATDVEPAWDRVLMLS